MSRRDCHARERAKLAARQAAADSLLVAGAVAAFPELAGVGTPEVHHDEVGRDYNDAVWRDADGRPVAMVRPLPAGAFERLF